jgi:hypothetical protein
MSNYYRDKFAFYSKEKRSADPDIIFKDSQIEIVPRTTENWAYLLWGLLIFGPLIYWLTDRESTTIMILSIIWLVTFGYQLFNEIIDDNRVTIDMAAKTITIEAKLWKLRTIEFSDVESLKIKTKSFGRYDPLGRRIQIEITNRGSQTIASIRDLPLGDKVGRALRQLIGLRE